MPFTLSHAVVALPFVRSPLVPAAIAIGAMTPDLPLFVRVVVPDYSMTHNLASLALTTAIALALLLVWRLLIRPAVPTLAPGFVGERLPQNWHPKHTWQQTSMATLRETFIGTRGWLSQTVLLLISLALGVFSHIAWDSFTHDGRQEFAWLQADWGPLPAFKWLQHGSSVLGLLIIALWALVWLWRHPNVATGQGKPTQHSRSLSTLAIAALPAFLIIATVWGLIEFGPITAEWTVAHLAYRVLPPACAMWAVVVLALCVCITMCKQPPAQQSEPQQ